MVWILFFWFWSYTPLIISPTLWIKLTTGHLLLFFLCNFCSFFSYFGDVLVTNHFSLLLIDSCILASNYTREAFSILSLISSNPSELPQKRWRHGHNNGKWLKLPQSRFHYAIAHKSHHFLLFWCMLCTATPHISSSSENVNSTTRVFRLSFLFLWQWCYVTLKKWYALSMMQSPIFSI